MVGTGARPGRGAGPARAAAALLAAILAAAAACGRAPAPTLPAPEPLVERLSPERVVIRWDAAPPDLRVQVYAAGGPDDGDGTRLLGSLAGGRLELDGQPARPRPFFALQAPGEPRRVVAERKLPLAGAANFRDLGGYATADGRRVRWGRIYRSDALAELENGDLAYLKELGIRLVCDFRTESERSQAPDRLPETDPPQVAWLPIGGDALDPSMLQERILSGDLEGLDFAGMLTQANRAFVTEFGPRYAAMFQRVAEPGALPALVHCTAGKDRAGFGAAALLLALGVPRETVMRDFLLTNVFTAEHTRERLFWIRLASFFRTDPEALRPLFEVRPAYLQAAFDAIDERHGGTDAWLASGLGLEPALRARLLRELLE